MVVATRSTDRTRRLLAAVGVVAAAVVGTVGWILSHDGGDSSRHGDAAQSGASDATTSRTESRHRANGADAGSDASRTAESKPSEASDVIASTATADSPNPAFLGHGEIAVTLVDDSSGAPVGELPFVVYSERPSFHLFTRAVTDAKGEATIGLLPEDVVVFETPRRPPLAATVFATWLKPGQHKRVEMRLGHGGTVRGRVVDDLGHGVEGVQVTIDPRPGAGRVADAQPAQPVDPQVAKLFTNTTEVVATTDASGRYEAAALRSRPAAIWIEKKQMSPKREDEALLVFRWQLAQQTLRSLVHEGETVELRDVVFDRFRTYAGRVVDSRHDPVAGAIVSTRFERSTWLHQRCFELPLLRDPKSPTSTSGSNEPLEFRFDLEPGEEGFALAREESLTGADGSFELALSRDGVYVGGALVATHDGRQASFALPKSSPGSRTDGLEFVLPAQTQLLLDLRESDGSAFELARRGSPFGLLVGVVTREGAELQSQLRAGGGSLYGVSFDVAPESLAQLVVGAPDHFTATHSFTSPPLGRPTIALTLRRRPSFELAFRFHYADDEQKRLLGERGLSVTARARPWSGWNGVDRADPTTWIDGAGFDTQFFQPSRKLDVALHVPARRKWSVQLHGPFAHEGNGEGEVDLGWFESDGTTHEVELPKVSAEFLAQQAAMKKLQEENQTRLKVKPGAVGAVVIDAATNRPITTGDVLFVVEHATDEHAVGALATGTRELLGQTCTYVNALPGDYSFRVRAHGYRDSQLLTATVTSDQPVDVGRVLLEPLPVHRLKVFAADGSAAVGWSLTFLDPNATPPKTAYSAPFPRTERVADDGVVTLSSELPSQLVVTAWRRAADAYSGGSVPPRFELDAWSDDSAPELRLPLLRHCVVRVDQNALAEELRSSSCQVWVETGVRSPNEAHSFNARSSILPFEGERRFTFDAPAGRYTLRARGTLLEADDLPIEVKDVDEPQEFTLVARPR